jgi:hypothetical protein
MEESKDCMKLSNIDSDKKKKKREFTFFYNYFKLINIRTTRFTSIELSFTFLNNNFFSKLKSNIDFHKISYIVFTF